MCHSRSLNNKINNFRKRALRIVSQDKKSDFENLLKNDKLLLFTCKLNYVVTEIYKVKNNISPEIVRDF